MLFLAGLCWLCSWVLYVVRFVYARALPKRTLADLGPWVCITGATDGIGRAYAFAIAAKSNVSLFLVGRNSEKLEAISKEISELKGFSQKVRTFVLDFGTEKADYASLKKELDQLEIGCLINNVGMSYPSALYYNQLSPEDVDALININVTSTFKMTYMVYGGMKSRGRGAIVSMGSAASLLSEPLLAQYAGVKSAVQTFSEALQAEAREFNVLVQCQTPAMVVSKMSKIRKPSLTVPTAEHYANDGLAMILGATIQGPLATPTVISPYWAHFLLLSAVSLLPRTLFEKIRLASQKVINLKYLDKTAARKSA